jgi:hypothetical protein
VSSLISSSFSWQYFDPANDEAVCIRLVKLAWYCALMLVVCAIGSSSQQLVALHRLSSYPDDRATSIIHCLLTGKPAGTSSSTQGANIGSINQLSFAQGYLWQIPVMLLNASLYLFTGGLCILVYWDVSRAFQVPNTWSAVRIPIAISMPFLRFVQT